MTDELTCDDCGGTDDVETIEDPAGYGSDTHLCVRCRTRRGIPYKESMR